MVDGLLGGVLSPCLKSKSVCFWHESPSDEPTKHRLRVSRELLIYRPTHRRMGGFKVCLAVINESRTDLSLGRFILRKY